MGEFLGLVALGLAVGIFGTLIGAGGGFILLPVLAFLYPKEDRSLIATISLAVVFCNAVSGSIGYARQKKIDYRAGGAFALATLPGAIIGAKTTEHLHRGAFDIILGGTLMLGSVMLIIATRAKQRARAAGQAAPGPLDHAPHVPLDAKRMTIGVVLSFGVGFLSSLLGIGGGIIHVPALVFLLAFPIHIATATSHFVLAFTAGVGTITHIVSGNMQGAWERTIALSLGVVVGAQIGAHLSKRAPSMLIISGLSIALTVVAIRLIVGALRGG